MYCSICGKLETQVNCEGKITPVIRPHAHQKQAPVAMICSHCTYVLSQTQPKIDWEMNLAGLKQAVQMKKERGTKMMRTK